MNARILKLNSLKKELDEEVKFSTYNSISLKLEEISCLFKIRYFYKYF